MRDRSPTDGDFTLEHDALGRQVITPHDPRADMMVAPGQYPAPTGEPRPAPTLAVLDGQEIRLGRNSSWTFPKPLTRDALADALPIHRYDALAEDHAYCQAVADAMLAGMERNGLARRESR